MSFGGKRLKKGVDEEFFSDSGGDVYVLVASEQEAKVGAIREAFQSVFGRATVV